MIIGIAGTDGSGKGSVVDHLKDGGFHHYSAREMIVSEIKKRGLDVHRPNMKLVGNAMRAEHGGSVIVKLAIDDSKLSGHADFVIESIRTLDEVELLHKSGGLLLAVDAEQNLRYERIYNRGSETDNITFAQFVEQELAESTSLNPAEQNKISVIKMADYNITNNGTLEELHSQIDEFLQKLT
jgi:dephospho-CoA kinase